MGVRRHFCKGGGKPKKGPHDGKSLHNKKKAPPPPHTHTHRERGHALIRTKGEKNASNMENFGWVGSSRVGERLLLPPSPYVHNSVYIVIELYCLELIYSGVYL